MNTKLFLDHRNIASADNLKLELGTVTKHPSNPLFVEEFFQSKPWEARYDNLYPTVLYDEEEEIFKLWYHVFLIDGDSNETPLVERPGKPYTGGIREDGVLYAISKDGLTWEKPNLGLIEFNGSTANNIVMSRTSHGVHSGGVLKEPHEPDPTKRYKYFHQSPRTKQMAVAFSADGLHWTQPILWPEHNAVGDTHNNALWAPELGKYVGISRNWSEGLYKGLRTVVRTESDDFVHWSDPVEIMRGADAHDQIYSMPIFRYKDIYLGLPALFHKGNSDAADWDTVTTELAWSPDTIGWDRICPGEQLIPLGSGNYPTGDYDCGCIYAAAPVIKDETIFIYYGGSNGLHNNWREGSFNLATLPVDRFAGLTPQVKDTVSTLVTAPIEIAHPTLTLNLELEDGGQVRVALLDGSGQAIEGFELENCIPIKSGGIAVPIRWQTQDPKDLNGGFVKLVVEISQGKVYAISGGQ